MYECLDSINHVIAWTSMMDNTSTFQHSYASAVAGMDNTKITVTPSTVTAAGPGVPAGQPGVPFELTLNEGEVPSTWINDVGVFTREAGATVTIDGVPIPDAQWNPVADSNYEVARVPLGDGVHVLDGGDVPFSVIIIGWDQHDSYSYLGGTGTKIVNPTTM
ncbi:hypothetical protein SAMN02745121_01288 [Nannocystis exedens]|uniref:IgGFc-binding protein N-terminal domain-containing protein n=1 Tax=Nannocystis exedens TaxID=54 RepID=A0A1I1UT13_9BACT|nr:hypothetical protein [Nannocystis exedens]PCC72079.1 hypothetical protein NAEX_05158 [Nannocystis exedens]SFD73972.1 hypothetical protein SAMN02745121_01288 [Nannocystis exedens]